MAVAFVTPHVEAPVGHGVFDGAVFFVAVGAIGEIAAAHVGADVSKVTGDFFGDYVPKLELANARRIDDATPRPDSIRNEGGNDTCRPRS